jgi:hypothetical protein
MSSFRRLTDAMPARAGGACCVAVDAIGSDAGMPDACGLTTHRQRIAAWVHRDRDLSGAARGCAMWFRHAIRFTGEAVTDAMQRLAGFGQRAYRLAPPEAPTT